MRMMGVGLVWAVVSVAGLTQNGMAQDAAAHTGMINPGAAMALGGKVFTVDTDGGAVRIAGGDGEKRVAVGREPVALAGDTRRGLVWVANAGDGSLSVIDAKTGSVVGTVGVGRNPYSVVVDAEVGRGVCDTYLFRFADDCG